MHAMERAQTLAHKLMLLLMWSGGSLAAFTGPYKMTFASSDPVAAQAFCEKYAV